MAQADTPGSAPSQKEETERDRLTFRQMYEQELDSLQLDAEGRKRLWGLALSGGGIRSATFNLGVIQALLDARRLSRFEYLSTVSGGGYIGSWLSALIYRLGDGDVKKLEAEYADAGGEKRLRFNAAVHFLRRYSNYLTPRLGIFGADTGAAIAIYARNFFLNVLILVTMLGALLLSPFWIHWIFLGTGKLGPWSLLGLCALCWSATALFIGLGARPPRKADAPPPKWFERPEALPYFIVVTLLLGGVLAAQALPQIAALGTGGIMWAAAAIVGLLAQLIFSGMAGLGWQYDSEHRVGWRKEIRIHEIRSAAAKSVMFEYALAAILSGACGGLLLLALAVQIVLPMPGASYERSYSVLLVSYAAPAFAVVGLIVIWLQIGFGRRAFTEQDREWNGRLSGYLIKGVCIWVAVATLYLGSALLFFWISGPGLQVTGFLGWLGTTLAGVLLGRGAKTSGNTSNRARELVVAIAPYVFIVGLVVLLACLNHALIATIVSQADVSVSPAVKFAAGQAFSEALYSLVSDFDYKALIAFAAMVAGIGLALALGYFIDINLFAFHQFYRNRLARCFLGASGFAKYVSKESLPAPALHEGRTPHEFTQLDPDDDLFMTQLAKEGKVQRPLHIVNTALNLVATKELAWQQRKAGSFVFTPLHCGYQLPPQNDFVSSAFDPKRLAGGYRPTAQYFMPPKVGAGMETSGNDSTFSGPRLGMAFAISGAAAAPNAGYHSSPAVAFLLTVFNVRLGRWCGNTGHPSAWRETSPRSSLKYLFAELLGITNEDSPFVYLSDGGHFDNLGIYELARRRCKVIVASDASADPQFEAGDLAATVTKCRIDLGIDITFDENNRFTEVLRPSKETGLVKASYIVGTITYPAQGGRAEETGTLIYLKASLVEDLDIDIGNYATTHRTFPHESTADQFFDETQFESYRKLGHRLGARLAPQLSKLEQSGAQHSA